MKSVWVFKDLREIFACVCERVRWSEARERRRKRKRGGRGKSDFPGVPYTRARTYTHI